jgi:hypothetical protein
VRAIRWDDTSRVASDWEERAARAQARFEDGEARLPEQGDERQRQLTRMGNAAWAAGLSFLMAGRRRGARDWLLIASETYERSWEDAPPGSWGRPIGALKSSLIAGDRESADEDARWALEAGAARSESPIGLYAAVLGHLVLGEDVAAGELGRALRGRDDFPASVALSVVALAAHDADGYETAIRTLLADFERREEFLEDTPVADTVLVLQVLAQERGIAVPLRSPLLPA